MSENTSSYIEMAYSSIRVFADDGTMDLGELNYLLGLAMKDGVVDDEEKRVLNNILKQAETGELSSAVTSRIAEIRRKHSL